VRSPSSLNDSVCASQKSAILFWKVRNELVRCTPSLPPPPPKPGEFTFKKYNKLLGDYYRRDDSYVRASASDRTLISASAWGETAFPRRLNK
jgi:hypothetical protein